MKKIIVLSISIVALLGSCKSSEELIELSDIVLTEDLNSGPRYNASETRKADLVHTVLDVKFDWEKSYLNGEATLTFTPYFYPISNVEIDAKGFIIDVVAESIDGEQGAELKYSYDNKILTVEFPETYTREDTFDIYIKYTARPNELKQNGSDAISGDKGLYFINADNSDPFKPQQIWTQGETEASSAWFPTIDAPNERMTQELYITVKDKFKTLSNGTLVLSTINNNNTRTDYWVQEQAHAPYLVMMAIGEFEIINDTWREIPVDYYVEKEYAPYAQMMFEDTPEMIELFSTKLGVDYPWDKYAQIIVRDYVSGAMENTSAVIHGEFVYNDDRSFLDNPRQDIIAHELFHHWFGDLVTCESWANLPLNESFATYGEYIWREHKLGLEEADYHLQGDLSGYLREAQSKQVDMIRFGYNDKEDMFDGHSYAKGGRILHMLRNYVGDEAFYASLNLYIEENKYKAVEIHNLRLAFEEVTGEDLNWFFNQWFLSSGHPDLEITYGYNPQTKLFTVEVNQMQNLSNTPLYKLPVTIDIYTENDVQHYNVVVDKKELTFEYQMDEMPAFANFDADKMLLCTKTENKADGNYFAQYKRAPLYLDRYEAITALLASVNSENRQKALGLALSDKHWNIRLQGINKLKDLDKEIVEKHKDKVISIAKTDKNTKVKAAAIGALLKVYKHSDMELYKNAANEKSYLVAYAGLKAVLEEDSKEAYELSKTLRVGAKKELLQAVFEVISKKGGEEDLQFMRDEMQKASAFDGVGLLYSYATYLSKQDEGVMQEGIAVLEEIAKVAEPWWVRYTAVNSFTILINSYQARIDNAVSYPIRQEKMRVNKAKLEDKVKRIKEAETHERLKALYGVNQ